MKGFIQKYTSGYYDQYSGSSDLWPSYYARRERARRKASYWYKRGRRPPWETREKAFADPRQPGYGGGPWPFDVNMAMTHYPYRNGVRRAIAANWTDGLWRHSAKKLFLQMLQDEMRVAQVRAAEPSRTRAGEYMESMTELYQPVLAEAQMQMGDDRRDEAYIRRSVFSVPQEEVQPGETFEEYIHRVEGGPVPVLFMTPSGRLARMPGTEDEEALFGLGFPEPTREDDRAHYHEVYHQ